MRSEMPSSVTAKEVLHIYLLGMTEGDFCKAMPLFIVIHYYLSLEVQSSTLTQGGGITSKLEQDLVPSSMVY
ncbi:hypothetical protein XELAEV_18039757mg [Xenopus laevis]|uniref:Uncharacterized protein n=1 Tax=Xenopus laevis TaxID=8355 RepID=A0A974C861_XENLA|nr:hypothetical protein XELAEV_18039757mg [Xenopus laevis]